MKSLLMIALLLVAHSISAQQAMPLYSGEIPNAIDAPDEEAVRDPKEPFPFLLAISRPTLAVYLPKKPDSKHAAVIILPGGSYRGVSILKEGTQVALAFQQMGIAAFVLKYRSPDSKHMMDRTLGPLQDAQQAIKIVRARAQEWHVDPARIGIVGFSAGGHLAATAATQFNSPVLPDKSVTNLRPDFAVLLYPVISMSDALTHALSRSNLLGESASPEAIRRYSAELNVTEQTPPTFLMHAADDKTVNVLNSLRFFEALQAAKVRAELHVYPQGGHGFGLENATTKDRWIERCQNWLIGQGMLAAN